MVGHRIDSNPGGLVSAESAHFSTLDDGWDGTYVQTSVNFRSPVCDSKRGLNLATLRHRKLERVWFCS